MNHLLSKEDSKSEATVLNLSREAAATEKEGEEMEIPQDSILLIDHKETKKFPETKKFSHWPIRHSVRGGVSEMRPFFFLISISLSSLPVTAPLIERTLWELAFFPSEWTFPQR